MEIVTEECRTDIALSEHLTATLMTPIGEDSLESAWIRSIVERYNEILCRNCPSFEENEWFFLLSVLGDPILNITDQFEYHWDFLANFDEHEPQLELLADHKALADRIRAMSYEQQCAIVEVSYLLLNQKKGGSRPKEVAA